MGLTASVEYLGIAMNYAKSLGVDTERIYRKAGFDASILKKPGARIPVDQFSAVWDVLEEETPDRDLSPVEVANDIPGRVGFSGQGALHSVKLPAPPR